MQEAEKPASGAIEEFLRRVVGVISGKELKPPPAGSDSEPADIHKQWLWLLEAAVPAEQLRKCVDKVNFDDRELGQLIRYFAGKSEPSQSDLERLDWLLTYLFRRRYVGSTCPEPADILREIGALLNGVAVRDHGGVEVALAELAQVRRNIASCRNFAEMVQGNWLACGRAIKERLRPAFSDPEVLASLVCYNLSCGAKFDQLLSPDVEAAVGVAGLRIKEYRAADEHFRHWACRAALARPEAAESAHPREAAWLRNGDREPEAPDVSIDSRFEEDRLDRTIERLVTLAHASKQPLTIITLANCELAITPLEYQSLVADYSLTEMSFRADLARLLRRSTGVLAAIAEELESLKAGSESDKARLKTLLFLHKRVLQVLPEVEMLRNNVTDRGLGEKAEQLTATVSRLRASLARIDAATEPRT